MPSSKMAGIVTDRPSRREQYLTLGAVATGYFSVQLALTPISAILPSLTRALHADLPQASWIVIGYLLSLSAFLLLAGRLGDLFGHRQLFLGGLTLFSVASLLCGQAQTAPQLIFFRTLQGLGSAFVTANSLALIANVFPPAQRGRAVGVVAMSQGFGSFVGIGLGALFLRYLSWSWAFYLTTLTGAIALVLTLRVGRVREPRALPIVDWIGAVGLFLVMLTLFLGMNHFHGAGGDETYHVGFIGLSTLFAAGLYWVERKRPHPLIEFRHFTHLPFAASVTANGIVHMTMMGVIFLIPFLVEQVLGLTPFESALTLALTVLPSGLFSILGGWLHDRFDSTWQRAGTMAGIALGLTAMGFAGRSYWLIVTLATLLGIGMGLFLSSNNTMVVTSLPPDSRGFASGMLETTRQFGHGLAVSLASAVIGVSLPGASLVPGEPTPFLVGFRTTALAMGSVAFLGVLASLAGIAGRKRRVSHVLVEEPATTFNP